MNLTNTQSDMFGSNLNLALDDLEISTLLEEICNYLEIIEEGFREEQYLKKDLDLFHGKVVSPNNKLDEFIKRFETRSTGNKKKKYNETEDEAALRVILTTILLNKTSIPLARPLLIQIERGKQLSKITIGVGTEQTIDWSEILNRFFRSLPKSLFKLTEEFKFEQAEEPA